uniref:NADH-ubiquinone oxidoreductase chain 2 n=1 Tax=Parapoynx crisonalis TaxID=1375902 RepID=A0A1B0VKS9_9NEOP|nr:NADH dehydrogenase subunit 2 [Parapoynx crisonalis]AMT85313.1 NADH dehydrogenase subunit 2 [Parapoynx crisonalis]
MFFSVNFNKMFFFFILFFSTMISISSNSWFGSWIGLEINLLSFVPLISNNNNMISEASLKYFLTQSIASINFLFCILIKLTLMKNFEMNQYLSIMLNSSLLMKMGSAPFHFWFPIPLYEGLSWFNSFILMTWQKITPIILISYYLNKKFIIIIIMMNAIIGAIGGLNQTSIRKLMAFSSINNLGWMLSAIMISENLWMFYFFIYSIMIMIMCMMFSMLNVFFINQLFFVNMNYIIKLSIIMNFLSLGGIPPFIGFFSKWIIINFLINNELFILNFILIMSSLIILFFYIRIIYSSFMFNYLKLKWINIKIKNKMFYKLNFLSFISIWGMLISTFFYM